MFSELTTKHFFSLTSISLFYTERFSFRKKNEEKSCSFVYYWIRENFLLKVILIILQLSIVRDNEFFFSSFFFPPKIFFFVKFPLNKTKKKSCQRMKVNILFTFHVELFFDSAFFEYVSYVNACLREESQKAVKYSMEKTGQISSSFEF